ncbi:hypothetical protein GCM10009693_26280 [Leucobacter chromiireducens subsp. chromiireducens]
MQELVRGRHLHDAREAIIRDVKEMDLIMGVTPEHVPLLGVVHARALRIEVLTSINSGMRRQKDALPRIREIEIMQHTLHARIGIERDRREMVLHLLTEGDRQDQAERNEQNSNEAQAAPETRTLCLHHVSTVTAEVAARVQECRK